LLLTLLIGAPRRRDCLRSVGAFSAPTHLIDEFSSNNRVR
jgi:hypothetical protein